ncbi:hypothetical protein N9042_00090 [bacterium]|nr:hypothetical protein [bacterium]
MALTTITGNMVSVNAIQGTLIADNAITAVHIATNAVSGTLIADNAVTAVHIAQNSITVTQLADDCVESDKIADGIITTNHLNKAMISSQTEVTAATGDFVLLGDTSDSNNLKKTPVSSLAALAAVADGAITSAKLDTNIAVTGTLNVGGAFTSLGIDDNADATAITIDSSENVGIGASSPSAPLHILKDGGNAEVEILRLSHGDTDHTNGQNDAALAITFDIPASEAGTRDTRIAAKIVGGKGINGANDWFTSGANTNFQGQLDFYTRKDDVLTNQMTLSHLGLGIGTAAPAVSLDVGTSTNAIRLPNGTTAQRPTGANGMLRYNSTIGGVEEYRGGGWHNLSAVFSGSGGTTYTTGIYTVHKFTSSGAITFNSTGQVDVLVVAGGGGGGTNANVRGSGGGAGGLIYIAGYPVAATSYTVGIGAGGAEDASGTNSTFAGNSTTLTANGGGKGGDDDSTDDGEAGGSGGGNWYPGYPGAPATQPTNTSNGTTTFPSTGFGFPGGTSGGVHPYGSGGGGAGAAGYDFNHPSNKAEGGPGKNMSSVYGTSVGESGWFAGGGGSGAYPPNAGSDDKFDGGQGGGGRGWNGGTESAQNGTANTGGGGGAGGSGGSGIVLVRYIT